MNPRIHLPLEIRVRPYLRDHRFESRTILPAVESLRLLAESVQSQRPDGDVHVMTDASFPRFLFIPEGDDRMEAVSEIQISEQGDLIASLLTVIPSLSGRITRMKEHARVCFPKSRPDVGPLPFSEASRMNPACFEVTPFQLYRELVPLGPAFQNVCSGLQLTQDGALAQVRAAVIHQHQPGILGSPFPMDAAMHCACAWGQRFAGIVAFPVGFATRIIFRPIVAGEICVVRIIPVRTERESLTFDIWIYSIDGAVYETMLGVMMRDVSGGRLKPPVWIQA